MTSMEEYEQVSNGSLIVWVSKENAQIDIDELKKMG